MRKKLLTSFVLLIIAVYSLKAQGSTPFTVTSGFNADVVAEANPASTYTNTTFDNSEYVLKSKGYTPDNGLPIDGKITSAQSGYGYLKFQLAAYNGNNSLRLTAGNTGTLEFSNNLVAEKIAILASAGNGATSFTGTITFTDNSTQTISSQSVPDWYDGANYAIHGIGRVLISNNTYDNNTSNPRLYQIIVNIDSGNQRKAISKISFTKASETGTLNIMAVSAIKNYCTPQRATQSGTELKVDLITKVALQTLENTSTRSKTTSYYNNTSGYNIPELAKNTTYSITVAGGGNNKHSAVIWIDFNDDGDFEDTGEMVGYKTENNRGTFTFNITIPSNATLDVHRMRVLWQYNSNASNEHYNDKPCTADAWGQTEDYLVKIINNCLSPSNLGSNTITSTSATISWTASTSNPTGGYDYYFSTSSTAPTSSTTPTGNVATGTSKNLTSLTSNTTYYVWVRSKCSGTDVSDWAGPHSFTTTQILATLPYTDDFTTNQFSFVNGTQTNKWYHGSSFGNPGGSIYISNDNGTSNAYTTGSATVVQAYRDIVIPNNASIANFSFDWKAYGESSYDYFRVWLVPSSFIPTAGTQITADEVRIQVGANMNQQNSWQTYSTSSLNISSFAGQTMRLVFEWRNDGNGGTTPPAAIDNISLKLITCIAPSGITASNVTYSSATILWTASTSNPTGGYDYYYSTSSTAPTSSTTPTGNLATGTSKNLTSLTSNTTYYVWVRSNCGGGDYSEWNGPATFTTIASPGGISNGLSSWFLSSTVNAGSVGLWQSVKGNYFVKQDTENKKPLCFDYDSDTSKSIALNYNKGIYFDGNNELVTTTTVANGILGTTGTVILGFSFESGTTVFGSLGSGADAEYYQIKEDNIGYHKTISGNCPNCWQRSQTYAFPAALSHSSKMRITSMTGGAFNQTYINRNGNTTSGNQINV